MIPDRAVAYSMRPMCGCDTDIGRNLRSEWGMTEVALRAGGSGGSKPSIVKPFSLWASVRNLLHRKEEPVVSVTS
jgi:hypothetical protein